MKFINKIDGAEFTALEGSVLYDVLINDVNYEAVESTEQEETKQEELESDIDYDKFTKDELIEMLSERGIEHNTKSNKMELIELLKVM